MSFLFLFAIPRKTRSSVASTRRMLATSTRPTPRLRAAVATTSSRSSRARRFSARAGSYGSFVRPFGGF